MKVLGNFIKWFLYITVGILIVCGISYSMTGCETVPVDVFWMILLAAFVTALVTVVFICWPEEEDGKVKTYVRLGLHYIVLCVIMCFLGEKFGWLKFDIAGVVGMAIKVGIVYMLVFLAYYLIDIKQASDINKMLQEKYGKEEP